eukprot:801614_1
MLRHTSRVPDAKNALRVGGSPSKDSFTAFTYKFFQSKKRTRLHFKRRFSAWIRKNYFYLLVFAAFCFVFLMVTLPTRISSEDVLDTLEGEDEIVNQVRAFQSVVNGQDNSDKKIPGGPIGGVVQAPPVKTPDIPVEETFEAAVVYKPVQDLMVFDMDNSRGCLKRRQEKDRIFWEEYGEDESKVRYHFREQVRTEKELVIFDKSRGMTLRIRFTRGYERKLHPILE